MLVLANNKEKSRGGETNDARRDASGSCSDRFEFYYLFLYQIQRLGWLNFYFFFEAEIMNLRNLERVLAREEEVKKKAIVHKDVYNGPQVRFLSKDGKVSCKNCICRNCICLISLVLSRKVGTVFV